MPDSKLASRFPTCHAFSVGICRTKIPILEEIQERCDPRRKAPIPAFVELIAPPAAQTGSATLDSQALQAKGYGPIGVSVATSSGGSWLTAIAQGTSIIVSANQAGLKAGTYTGTVTLTSSLASTTTVGVTLIIYDTLPQLTVTPQTLTFSGPADNIPAQTLTVQSGGIPLSVALSFSTNNPAVSIFAATQPSQTPATIQVAIVAVSSQSVATGTHQGNITIGAGGQTVNVPVTATIAPASFQVPYMGSLVNAASQKVGPVSPGEIITIYGNSVGPFDTGAGSSVGAGHFHACRRWLRPRGRAQSGLLGEQRSESGGERIDCFDLCDRRRPNVARGSHRKCDWIGCEYAAITRDGHHRRDHWNAAICGIGAWFHCRAIASECGGAARSRNRFGGANKS
jgi:hypothetical protein